MISEQDFEAQYQPRTRDNGELFEHEDVKGEDLHHVWTIVEGESGNWYASPGFHLVNRVGYVVTAQPWTDSGLDAIWCEMERTPLPSLRGHSEMVTYLVHQQAGGEMYWEREDTEDNGEQSDRLTNRLIDQGGRLLRVKALLTVHEEEVLDNADGEDEDV